MPSSLPRPSSLPVASPATTSPITRRRHPASVRDVLVVVLAVTSGATDAIGFLALGAAFTSVMTGNMVLFGIAAAHGDLVSLGLTAAAIASFVAGAAAGARIAGTAQSNDSWWPAAINKALWLEMALFAVFAACWWALDSAPSANTLLPLLALNAAALGLQSSAIQRFGVSGLSTTYMTGTLTSVVIKLVSGKKLAEVGHSLWILLGLIAGAALGALLVRHLPVTVPLSQLLSVGLVLLVAHRARGLWASPRD